MQNYVQDNYSKAQQVASNPYTPYQGEGVAPMNDMETSGMNAMYNQGASGIGMGAVNQGVNYANQAGSYSPQQVSYNAPTAAQIQAQQNPYTQQVVDATNQQMQQQLQIQQQQEAGSATGAGAFGGSREAVQQALNQKYANQNMANTDAALYNQSYTNAQQQANTNAQGAYQAALANQSAGLTGNQQTLQAGVDLGALGQGQQTIGSQNANNMYMAGSMAQNQQQNVDNYNQNLYSQAQGAGERQLQDLMAGTYGGSAGGTTTQTAGGGNNATSAIGTGLATAGMLSAMGASGMASGMGGGALALLSLLSDKNAKEGIKDIDPESAVMKYKAMPISTWQYKPGIGMGTQRHIGPMAQDFAKAFGGDGHQIPVVDAIGSQAAAIKGLAQKVEKLERRGRK
ncbi:tail fiber domain-containing protein [Paraburkholderia oxyphila]|uniref:tail fiber domain-containing protein n=1 Tax=Paraburkholderia oxyphila TaxID=614212 RepID=UPI00048443F7|nr:tail fiber domain-containing protein [Paraburkholderia oxyphila]